MGYDEIECIFCYTCGGGNEITDNEIEICFTCLEKHAGKRITGRVLAVFSQLGISSNITCDVCHETKKFVVNVRCCDRAEHNLI